jgi:membrane AbrB-like protein
MQYLRVIVVVMTASLVSRLLLGHDHAAAPSALAAGPEAYFPIVPLIETLAIAVAGALIAQRLLVPAGALLVPLLLATVLHTTGVVEITLPPWLLEIIYAVVGWYVGLGFTREVVIYALRAIPRLLLATIMLIGLCALSAWMLTRLLHIDPLTAYLATSPGGLDSVAIIAIGSHVDIPFVMAVQTLRLFIVILTGPRIAKLISRHA